MLLTGAMLMAPMNVFAAETETEAQTEAQTEASAFPFTLVTKDDQEVTFTHVPERVISTNPNTGEELMHLDLAIRSSAPATTMHSFRSSTAMSMSPSRRFRRTQAIRLWRLYWIWIRILFMEEALHSAIRIPRLRHMIP